MADFNDLSKLRSEIARIFTRTERNSPIKYRLLKRLITRLDWQEESGKGDHRKFWKAGYPRIEFDCPGEGSEVSASAFQEKLCAAYQPIVDGILKTKLNRALLDQIDSLIANLTEAVQEISAEKAAIAQQIALDLQEFADSKQQEINQQASEFLDRELQVARELAQERVNHEQQQKQQDLEAAQQLIDRLDEQVKDYLSQIEQLRAQLAIVQQQQNDADQQILILAAELSRVQAELEETQTELRAKLSAYQEVRDSLQNAQQENLSLKESLLRVELDNRLLKEALSQLQAEQLKAGQLKVEQITRESEAQYHQVISELTQFKRQQKRKDIATLLSLGGVLILGLLGFRALVFAEEELPSNGVPVEQTTFFRQ